MILRRDIIAAPKYPNEYRVMTMVRSPKRGPSMAKKQTGAQPLIDNKVTVRLSKDKEAHGWNAHDSKANNNGHGMGKC